MKGLEKIQISIVFEIFGGKFCTCSIRVDVSVHGTLSGKAEG